MTEFTAALAFLRAQLDATFSSDPARRPEIDSLFGHVIGLERRFCDDAYAVVPAAAP